MSALRPDRDDLRVMPNDPRHAEATRSEQIWAAQAEAQRLHRHRQPTALDAETRHEAKQRRAAHNRARDARIRMEAGTYFGRTVSG